MEKAQDVYINHEARLDAQASMQNLILSRLDKIESKMDSQFKWVISTIITLFGGIILHFTNLMV